MSSNTSNPSNFANMPTDQVKEIASMGGKASHGPPSAAEMRETYVPPQGTMANDDKKEDETSGRRADGTFTKGSEAAKEAGHNGGVAAANN